VSANIHKNHILISFYRKKCILTGLFSAIFTFSQKLLKKWEDCITFAAWKSGNSGQSGQSGQSGKPIKPQKK
jgi:hypothetical protein